MSRYQVTIEAEAIPIGDAPPHDGCVKVIVEAINQRAAIAQAVIDSQIWAWTQDYSVRVTSAEVSRW